MLAGRTHRDGYLWFNENKCDGLLFNSLYGFSGGDVPIIMARNADGKWFRYPSMDCLQTGESKSDISRDMLLGLLYFIYAARRLDYLEDLIAYDDSHQGIMGDSDGSEDGKARVLMSPPLRYTMHLLREYLGGAKNELPLLELWTMPEGFEAHLEVLHITLRGLITGRVSELGFKALEYQATRQPDNALYQAAYSRFKDGDQNKAVAILLKESWFPADRLPASRDRCINYLFMHDMTAKNLAQCPEEKKIHSATDFLVAAQMVLQ